MAQRKSWGELSPAQQTAVVVGGTVEVALTLWALQDLVRRPAVEVRGPKPVWFGVLFVQPVGPLAYLGWGRRGG